MYTNLAPLHLEFLRENLSSNYDYVNFLNSARAFALARGLGCIKWK